MADPRTVLLLGWCVVAVGTSLCRLFPPPQHGLLACELSHNTFVCQATCTTGYMFWGLERKLRVTCDLNTGQWDTCIRDCVDSCRTPLLSNFPETFNITASSGYINMSDKFGTEMWRSTQDVGIWRSDVDDSQQYLQIDFPGLYRITGVVTRGEQDTYVTQYRMMFSVDGRQWFPYGVTSNEEKFFRGNSDGYQVHTESLPCPHTAKHVRIIPVHWSQHIAMTVDLLGCPYQRKAMASSAPPTHDRCTPVPPPRYGAISCERKDGVISCTYTCKRGYVFETSGDAQPIAITRQCADHETPSELEAIPECVAASSNQHLDKHTREFCLQEAVDCYNVSNGDYQFCGDCRYFSTCAETVFYLRPCPATLKFNALSGRCDFHSDTCVAESMDIQPIR